MTAMPAEHPPTAVDFLGHFFDGAEGWAHTFAIDRTTGERHVCWARTDDPAGLVRATRPYLETSCIWFGVAPRQRNLGPRRGESGDCTGIVSLWLDIDIHGPGHVATDLPPDRDSALALLGDFPVRPSILIYSGGGYQAYWMLHELLPLETATGLLLRWGATWAEKGRIRGWHVDNVFEPARVLRLPATVNRKPGTEPTPVEVVHADWSRRFNPDDLDQWCIDPPAAEIALNHRNIPYIGPERPGDAFNAVTDPGMLLERWGWQFDHIDRGTNDRHYRAPHHRDERGICGATVYADGHTTIWSETFARANHLEVRRPYDPFGLVTHVQHQGDWTAATVALKASGFGAQGSLDDWAPAEGRPLDAIDLSLAHIVDWRALWAGDHADENWLAEPLVPRGRAVALYAPAKAGKSSVALTMVADLATGRPIFGEWPCQPTSILYLDYEMTESDLVERLSELGYGPDDDLTNLHYALLPSLPPLDTKDGALAVLELADHFDAQLIVVDTFGRAVSGEENEADTVRAFYRHTGLALKAAGRAVLRTDHSGKDLEKGQRGTSAKADDVDVVWRLTRSQDGVSLKRTHSRMSWISEVVNLSRTEDREGVVRWRVAPTIYPEGTRELAEVMDGLEIPFDCSARKAAKRLRAAGWPTENARVNAAVRWRREIEMGRFGVSTDLKSAPQNQRSTLSGTVSGAVSGAVAKDLHGAGAEQCGAPSESACGAPPLPIKGAVLPGPLPDPGDDPIFGHPEEHP